MDSTTRRVSWMRYKIVMRGIGHPKGPRPLNCSAYCLLAFEEYAGRNETRNTRNLSVAM